MPVKKSGGVFAIKNPRREEIVTVERKSANGVYGHGKWYNVSKFKLELLEGVLVGGTYKLTISTATKDDGRTFDNVIDLVPVAGAETVSKTSVAKAGFQPAKQVFKERDFDAEARGKTRCAIYAAAVTGLAKSVEEAIEIAQAGVAFSFGDNPTPEKPVPPVQADMEADEVEFPS